MKRISLFFLLAVGVQVCGHAQSTVLHYDKPATYFEEALPIGNGSMGAMVYGRTEEEKLSLNDITLWTGEPDRSVYSPEAYKAIDGIRTALFNEDYREADKLQHAVQGHYTQNYQPLGTLTFTTNSTSNPEGYARTLDIQRAVATVDYSGCHREYFASAPDSVIVVLLQATEGRTIGLHLRYHCQLPHQMTAATKDGKGELTIDGYAAWTSKPSYTAGKESFHYDSNRGIHFRTIVQVVTKDGHIAAKNGDELRVTDATEVMLLIANVTSFNGADKDPVREGRDYKTLVRKRIDEASAKSFEQLLSRHIDDYRQYFNRMSLQLGTTDEAISRKTTEQQLLDYNDHKEINPDLEELYFNYGRYLLISCSRTEAVPANLQGLWNESMMPPWSCNYTSNINVEENYWPALPAGLMEMNQSLLGFIRQLPKTGEATAKAYYGVDKGWCLGHNTDIWAMTCPVGEHHGDPVWANWMMGGAWISTHLWEHYAFTMDLDYLRSVWPVLRGAADFCLGWLVEHDGHLLTAPATSPENFYRTSEGYEGRSLYGGFADLAMIRECLTDAAQAARALGESQTYIDTLEQTLRKLLPYRVGHDGNLQEWYHDWEDTDPHHRHQSHLFGLYPGHHITPESTPELAAACKRSLEIRGDRTTGWSAGWRVNLQARLYESEAAYHMLRVLLNYVSPDGYHGPNSRRGGGTYPNLFDAHSPFQIDGNFGGCAGVMEMLAQSTLIGGGKSQALLLPAMPEAWKAGGEVCGLRLRGGYEADFSWKNGEITHLAVRDCRPVSDTSASQLLICHGKKRWQIKTRSGQQKVVVK